MTLKVSLSNELEPARYKTEGRRQVLQCLLCSRDCMGINKWLAVAIHSCKRYVKGRLWPQIGSALAGIWGRQPSDSLEGELEAGCEEPYVLS